MAEIFIGLGLIFLLGLATDAVRRRLPLPRVTLLVMFGFAVGPSGADLLPRISESWFPLFANLALVMVGFLLGEKFRIKQLRRHGRDVLWISFGSVVGTALLVAFGLRLFGFPIELALLLGTIATATAPAATSEVVREYRAKGPFSKTLLGIVAVDDAWGLMLFSMVLAACLAMTGQDGSASLVWQGLWDVGGALLLGLVLGYPSALLSGRIAKGEPTLIEALGVVFLCGGLAMWLEVSFLIAAMVLGGVVANTARHHKRPFHAIEGIEWPFMILFFMLAGASLELEYLLQIGWLGLAYVVLRVLGRLGGAWLGARLADSEPRMGRWMGLALMPQAGVALGMALMASDRVPALQETLLPVVIGSTVFFELAGPLGTRWALFQVGEARKGKEKGKHRRRRHRKRKPPQSSPDRPGKASKP